MTDTVDPKELGRLFDDTITLTDDLQQGLVKTAQSVGYSRDALVQTRQYWVRLTEMAKESPELTPFAMNAFDFIRSYHDEIAALQCQANIPSERFHAAAGTADAFLAVTDTTYSIVMVTGVAQIQYRPRPFPIEDSPQTYAARFSRLDPALGRTYQGIWEALYATRADPARGALFLMRQAFDHLFGLLAPDEKVRTSKYWKRKSGKKPNQVSRSERLKYAAFTHIKDPNRAGTMAASTKQVQDLYRALNMAHRRGELDEGKARKALLAMRRILEEWADAIGL